MNVLPKYLTQTALWDIYPQGAIGQALEIYASIFGKGPVQTEPIAMPVARREGSQSGKVKASSKVMVIPIQGVIIPESDSWYGIPGLDYYTSLLKQGEADPEVVGFVLEIDSPGGSVMMLAEFTEFLGSLSKPKVAFCKAMMCSAAYHIAIACDSILSIPYSALIGNIGTVYRTLDMIPLFEKLGAKYIEVYGKEAIDKDLGMKEAKEGNPEKLREMLVTPFQEMFLEAIAKYRPAVDGKAQKGAVYVPPKALEHNLIDGVGTLADAIDKVYELAPSSINTTTPKSQTNMKLTKVGILNFLNIKTDAKTDDDLGIEDAVAIQQKATEFTNLQNQVNELTTTNATLKKDKEAAEAKVLELEQKLDAAPGAEPKNPVQGKPEKSEATEGEASATMEGEASFMEQFGW